MAYFSNGTEGMIFEERWCSRCVHLNGKDGKSGCPVMLSHILYAYEECNSKSNAKAILDILIPMKPVELKSGGKCNFPDECAMFKEGKPVEELADPPVNIGKPRVMPAMAEWAEKHRI